MSTGRGRWNPDPDPGAGGPFSQGEGAQALCAGLAGRSGGTFTMDTTFTLVVPASVYSGTYEGTVEYLVSSSLGAAAAGEVVEFGLARPTRSRHPAAVVFAEPRCARGHRVTGWRGGGRGLAGALRR